ncbi:sigma-70 family RNA polymerase sigma factor [Actinoplanes solisilvae]|uniref:sigma-70 family RNA polymerase sigma factor n=1 Tax=Actinoplanes solisilvae TaxID=2486853 RepID=UPI0013E40B6B|nr:sigma-70 family RNA polymerase sigma factor [Actinoplanes solisilvae]
MSPLADFLGVRERLLRIATRIAGSEAEDVVQDAWLRWQRVDHAEVHDPPAYLSRTTVHLSLNRAQQRPTTALTASMQPSPDPADRVAEADELRTALRLLVARLEPRSRVAYTLREAFEVPYREIGDLLGVSEVYARQLVRRARRRLAEGHDRAVSREDHRALMSAFHRTVHTGDPTCLADLAWRTFRATEKSKD